jgi:hypothetical protein
MTACCGWVQVPNVVGPGSGSVQEHGS